MFQLFRKRIEPDAVAEPAPFDAEPNPGPTRPAVRTSINALAEMESEIADTVGVDIDFVRESIDEAGFADQRILIDRLKAAGIAGPA